MCGGETEFGSGALFPAVAGAVERLGYECVHVGIKTDSGRPRLQVLIDSLGGINVADCERVSKALSRMLDEGNFWADQAGSYYLEVSSPGLERPLFTLPHYARFCGEEARLRLNEPIEGRKSLTGRITAAEGGRVTLYVEDEEREISVPIEGIRSGNLVFRGPAPKPPKGGERAQRGAGGRGPRPVRNKFCEKRHEGDL